MKNVHILTVKYIKGVTRTYHLPEREKIEVKDGLISFNYFKQDESRTTTVRISINLNSVEYFEDYEEDFDDEGNAI